MQEFKALREKYETLSSQIDSGQKNADVSDDTTSADTQDKADTKNSSGDTASTHKPAAVAKAENGHSAQPDERKMSEHVSKTPAQVL